MKPAWFWVVTESPLRERVVRFGVWHGEWSHDGILCGFFFGAACRRGLFVVAILTFFCIVAAATARYGLLLNQKHCEYLLFFVGFRV